MQEMGRGKLGSKCLGFSSHRCHKKELGCHAKGGSQHKVDAGEENSSEVSEDVQEQEQEATSLDEPLDADLASEDVSEASAPPQSSS